MKCTERTQIYTVGAYLSPMLVDRGGGHKVWVWVVDAFEDDSYCEGQYVETVAVADKVEDLFEEEEA